MEGDVGDPNASRLNRTISGLLHTLGWIGLYVGIAEPFIQYFIAGGQISNPLACIVATTLGVAAHGLAYVWPPERRWIRAAFTCLLFPVIRHRRMAAIIGVLALWTFTTYQIAGVRRDLDIYVMPRVVTSAQVAELKKLAPDPKQIIVIKENPHDDEG